MKPSLRKSWKRPLLVAALAPFVFVGLIAAFSLIANLSKDSANDGLVYFGVILGLPLMVLTVIISLLLSIVRLMRGSRHK